MRRMAMAMALVLAGCGESAAPRKPAAPAATADDGYRQKLLALSPSQRNSVFFKAIAANGGACPEVKRASYQQDYKDMTMWVAHCAITGDWAVFVNAAGYAQTRECRQTKQLGLPECKPLAG